MCLNRRVRDIADLSFFIRNNRLLPADGVAMTELCPATTNDATMPREFVA
jgi:hypothetical protein